MTNTYEPTRSIVGKLPKDFTRPASCNNAWIWDTSFIDYAAVCETTSKAEPHIASDPACYPSQVINVYPLDPAFFSPASICPPGFTSACNVTKNVFDAAVTSVTYGADASSVIKYVLKDGETAIGCCPTGYECDKYFVQSCTSTYTPGQIVSGTYYGRSCSSEPAVYTFPTTTDVLTLDFLPANQMNLWLLRNPEKDNHTSSGTSSGLSTGAKIGLGVGIPLGTIALGIVLFVWWHRNKKLEKERQRQKMRQAEKPTDEPVLPPHMEKPELQGSDVKTGVASTGPLKLRTELDAKTATSRLASNEREIGKLNANRAEDGTRHELDSSASATVKDVAELSSDPYRYELDAGEDARQTRREV